MKNDAQQHLRSSRGKETRAAILSTAVGVLSESGPEATTLRHVARRAGVNIATLMYYFPSKARLVAEVIQAQEWDEWHIVERWRDALTDQQLARPDLLKEALTELGIMIIDRVITDPSRFRLGVYTLLEAPKAGVKVKPALPAKRGEKSSAGEGSGKIPRRSGSPEKDAVRAILVRAIELGTLHCDVQELDDYIEGYTYLSRGFAIAHIREIAIGAENRDKIIRRFRKLMRRYVTNMLPGEKD
jgi:AcrR family transcriptional regulator